MTTDANRAAARKRRRHDLFLLNARVGRVDKVRHFLSMGVDVNVMNDGRSALMHAVEVESTEMLDMLLAHEDLDIDRASDDGDTALLLATRQSPAMVDRLLAAGANANHTDVGGVTALMHACTLGAIEMVESLLTAGAVVDAVDRGGNSPLLVASRAGHTDAVERLLATGGVAVNREGSYGKTALVNAATGGDVPMLELLLAHGADVNHREGGLTALIEGARSRSMGVVTTLLAAGADTTIVNFIGETALIRHATVGHTEAIKHFLAHGVVDVNHVDRMGRSALMSASSGGHVDVVKALLASGGVDVTLRNWKREGQTALDYANKTCRSEKHKTAIVAMLREFEDDTV